MKVACWGMFILTLGFANTCVLLQGSPVCHHLHPAPCTPATRPHAGTAAALSSRGVGIPGAWGGTSEWTSRQERGFSLCGTSMLVCASEGTFGKLGFTGTRGTRSKLRPKIKKQNKKNKYPSSRGEFPDGDNPITEDGHVLPLGPCETKVWVGEVKRVF